MVGLSNEDFSNREKLLLLKSLKRRVKELESKIKNDMRKKGECPHDNLVEMTELKDLRNGYRKYKCLNCGYAFKKNLPERGENC